MDGANTALPKTAMRRWSGPRTSLAMLSRTRCSLIICLNRCWPHQRAPKWAQSRCQLGIHTCVRHAAMVLALADLSDACDSCSSTGCMVMLR